MWDDFEKKKLIHYPHCNEITTHYLGKFDVHKIRKVIIIGIVI